MARILPIILFSLLISVTTAFGQSITSNQFPPGIRWKQIETERCILIFDEQISSYALEAASMIDSLYPPVESSLGTEVSKWPVILNNTLTLSNGYVTSAPEHSELFTMPIQGGGFGHCRLARIRLDTRAETYRSE